MEIYCSKHRGFTKSRRGKITHLANWWDMHVRRGYEFVKVGEIYLASTNPDKGRAQGLRVTVDSNITEPERVRIMDDTSLQVLWLAALRQEETYTVWI